MTRVEKFHFISALVGFIVNIIVLTGFISGAIIPAPEISFWLSPPVISILSYSFLVYTILILLYFIIQYKIGKHRRKRITTGGDYINLLKGISRFVYLLWIPSILIWSVAMYKLFVPDGGDIPEILFYISTASLIGGILFLGTESVKIDEFLNPEHYPIEEDQNHT